MSYKYYLKDKEERIYSIETEEKLPESKVLQLCNRSYPDKQFTACMQLTKDRHICKYCGWIAEGKDDDLLCSECRMDFGHAFYSEL